MNSCSSIYLVTDVFLNNISSFLSGYVDEAYDVFDVVHELDAATTALVAWLHDPDVEHSVYIYLGPELDHSCQYLGCFSLQLPEVNTELDNIILLRYSYTCIRKVINMSKTGK